MTHTSQYVVSPGSIVLVTGANGYIASHTINVLLELGYIVRGTTRTAMPWLKDYFSKQWGPNRFDIVLVPEFHRPDAFDDCVQGVSGIIHIVRPAPALERSTIES